MPEHPQHPAPRSAGLAAEVALQWQQAVAALDWSAPPAVLWDPAAPDSGWFPDARLDPVWNLVHRHAHRRGSQIAVQWEGEPGDRRTLTYAELSAEVRAVEAELRDLGLKPGDVVALHTSWLPETVAVLLACMAVGATWATLPISLPAEALSSRLAELSPTVLVTQDGAWRRGSVLPLKNRADEALASTDSVEHTVVIRRTGMDAQWFQGDMWYSDLRSQSRQPLAAPAGPGTGFPVSQVTCVRQIASHTTSEQYTRHTLGGILVTAAALHEHARAGDTFWCAGDVSWAVSTWHGLLGPLLHGDTVLIYEGTLDVPDHHRLIDLVERHRVSALITNPAVMRTLRSWRLDEELRTRATELKHLITAGEPVEPTLRTWMQEVFTSDSCRVSDGWGQVELGGIVHLRGPGVDFDPGGAAIRTATGMAPEAGQVGQLVLTRPVPGSVLPFPRTGASAGRHEEIATGDIVELTTDGGLRFHGRVDAVVSVAGQLVSLDAVARALREHPYVVDAVAIRFRSDEHGTRIVACVVTTGQADAHTAHELASTVRTELGGLARPHAIVFIDRIDPAMPQDQLADAVESLLPDAAWTALSWSEIGRAAYA